MRGRTVAVGTADYSKSRQRRSQRDSAIEGSSIKWQTFPKKTFIRRTTWNKCEERGDVQRAHRERIIPRVFGEKCETVNVSED